jgi:hypothetical protein
MKIAIYTTCEGIFGRLCQAWEMEFKSKGNDVEYISLPRGYRKLLPQPSNVDINLYMGGMSMFWPLIESGFPSCGRHILWLFEPLNDQERPEKLKLFISTMDHFNAIITMNTETLKIIKEYLPKTPCSVIPTIVHDSQIKQPLSENKRDIDILQLGGISERRKSTEKLFSSASIPASFVYGGYYGYSRYDLIAKAKVSLHIHRYKEAYFNHYRIIEAISVGSVIVTEPSHDMHDFKFKNEKHLIVSEIDKMPKTCQELLKSPSKRSELIQNAQNLLKAKFTSKVWYEKMISIIK